MSLVLRELRFALRALARAPGFSFVVVLTLALAVGLVTAFASALYGILYQSFDVPQPDRLVTVRQNMEALGGDPNELTSRGLFVDWRAQSSSFERMGAYVHWPADLTGGDIPEHVVGAAVSSGFFEVFGVQPALGRGFGTESEVMGEGFKVILADPLWQRRFGSDPELIGRNITVGGTAYEVVGILPKAFRPPPLPDAQIFTVLPLDPKPEDHAHSYVYAIGRIAKGTTLAAAHAEMDRVTANLAAIHPEALRDVRTTIRPMIDSVAGSFRRPLWILLAAAGLVLVLACVNVAGLLLVRSAHRRAEFALRAALGASRRSVLTPVVAELWWLGAAGAAAGWAVGLAAMRILRASAPMGTPRLEDLKLEPGIFVLTVVVVGIGGMVAGLLPLMREARGGRLGQLRVSTGTTSGRSIHRFRSALAIAQVAIGMVLLNSAGLLLQTYSNMVDVDTGLRTEELVLGRVALAPGNYPESDAIVAFLRAVEERVSAEPEVSMVGFASTLPLVDGISETQVATDESDPTGRRSTALYRAVTNGFYSVFGLQLIDGGGFPRNLGASSPPVAMVNQRFAAAHFGGENPIGRKLRLGDGQDPEEPWREIVGVVSDSRSRSLTAPPEPEVYVSLFQQPARTVTIVAKVSAVTDGSERLLPRAVAEVRGDQVVTGSQVYETAIAVSRAPTRFTTMIIGGFAAVALILAAVGVFGVLALMVRQRRREIAIRFAIGASKSSAAGMIAKWSGVLALLGIALGAGLVFLTSQALEGLLYEVAPRGIGTMARNGLILLVVTAFATLGPALRAIRVDAASTLKAE